MDDLNTLSAHDISFYQTHTSVYCDGIPKNGALGHSTCPHVPVKKVVARMLKDVLKRSLALGFGLAVTSKEQLEKAVEELVKKGEMTRSESQEFLKDLMKKGENTSNEVEAMVGRKVNQMLERLELVKKSEVEKLEQRITELEKRLGQDL